MNLQPIPGEAALSIGGKALVVSDLHIGIELDFLRKGVHLPSQVDGLLERLRRLAKTERHRTLYLLGDVKHTVVGARRWERREIPRFFEGLKEWFGEIHVIRGNHDGHLRELLPEGIQFHEPSGLRLKEVGMFHGHTWPSAEVMGAKHLLIGHNHPGLRFEDSRGFGSVHRCWLRMPVLRSDRYPHVPNEAIFLPSFSEYTGMSPVNRTDATLLGPLFRAGQLPLAEAQAYLLDGVHLGRLRELPASASVSRPRSSGRRSWRRTRSP